VVNHAPEVLAGRTVVVCRTESQGASLVSELTVLGALVVSLPLVEIVPPHDGGEMLRVALLGDYNWLVFTSANAVRATRSAIGQWPPTARLAAVGPATAAALADAGAPPDHVAPVATAAALAGSLPVIDGLRVLAPLAELAGPDLISGLSERGFEVTTVVAYRLADVIDLDPRMVARAAGADAVLLTSPSLAQRFSRATDGDWPPVVVSIGPRTAARIVELGGSVTATADPHTQDGLIAALVNTLGS
jgi:uroporphyrinogen-III synthase